MMTTELKDLVSDIKARFLAGREGMYEALAGSFKLFLELSNDKARAKELAKLYIDDGLKALDSTDLATKVVRLTLVRDSKRANPYAQVFRKARNAHVTAEGFRKFVDDHGGIERIRLSPTVLSYDDGKPGAAPMDRSTNWDKLVSQGTDYVGRLPALASLQLTANLSLGNLALLLVRRRVAGTGDLQVVEVIDEESGTLKSILANKAKRASAATSSK
jgi:hypothetical protein